MATTQVASERGPATEYRRLELGDDPHNQELGLCLLEDYLHTQAAARDVLLLAAAKHTAGHRKYGEPLEAYRRFTEALG